jgi:hypothetical protein
VFLVLLAFGAAAGGTSLLVFQATTAPVSTRQRALRADPALAETDVTVFAKYRELSAALEAAPASAVIAPASFGSAHQDYVPVLQFLVGDKPALRYRLLSLDEKWRGIDTSTGVVGVVDELGRRGMKEQVPRIAGTSFRKVKRVTKPEDLFPLLVLGNADFILIQPANLGVLQTQFTVKTVPIRQGPSTACARLFVKRATDAATVDRLRELAPETLAALGFSGATRMENSQ